jgi:hypothetical protein
VLLTEASRTVVPLVGPESILTHAATPTETETVTGPTIPTQRTAGESARAAAAYGFIADLPADNAQGVQINL